MTEIDNIPQPPINDNYNDDLNSDSNFSQFTPQSLDKDTFKQRNDPQELLYRFKLQLMNAYEAKKEKTDPITGKITIIKVIKTKKDGQGNHIRPRVNKRGVEDIISYVEKFLNGHTVQGNIESLNEYRTKMRFISNDLACHFISKRTHWGCDVNDIDILISNASNIIDLFLTRTLFNEERKSYGESYKETTHKEIKPENKSNIFQKFGTFLQGKGW